MPQCSLTLEETLHTQEQLAASPLPDHPQLALAGRSNVGKSSLLNALAGRRQLAKVSATPGKTASLNFYRAAGLDFYLVDLPGYGYARRSQGERRAWGGLIQAYLRRVSDLKALVLLLDCRLEPQQADLELVAFARSLGLALLPVLTKADKCGRMEQSRRQKQWQAMLDGRRPLLTSAAGPAGGRLGLDALWEAMLSYVPAAEV